MHIFYLMGKSAVGKDTVYQKLLVKFPMLRPLVPYTTRPQRQGEEEGREYHFVGEEQFLCLRESGRMIEERAYRTEKGSGVTEVSRRKRRKPFPGSASVRSRAIRSSVPTLAENV